MAKVKYKYNPEQLSYDKVKKSVKSVLVKGFIYLTAFLTIVALGYWAFTIFFDTPEERRLNRELEQMEMNYASLLEKMDRLDAVVGDIQQRDDNLYRWLFQSEPTFSSLQQAKQSLQRFRELQQYSIDELITDMTIRLGPIMTKIRDEQPVYTDLMRLANELRDTLRSIPAIQPIYNPDLQLTASGYGEKIHPIFGTKFFHKGIDFPTSVGTPVHATADGVVRACGVAPGFGNRIILNHANGYQTLYAHLSEFKVQSGSRVVRGQVIGEVGSTGISTGPHLHYEIHKDGKPVNPINYFFCDLTPVQYERLSSITNVGKTFD